MSKKIKFNSSQYLNEQIYTDYNEAYNSLLSFINEHLDESDIVIENKQQLHVQIKLGNKNSYVNIPCLIMGINSLKS